MKSKKFMKGVIWIFEILIMISSMLCITRMIILLDDQQLMKMLRKSEFIAVCYIFHVIVGMGIIIVICRNMRRFLNSAFSNDPFVKTSVITLKNIYKFSWILAMINLVEFNVRQIQNNVNEGVINSHIFRFGVDIISNSIYTDAINKQLSNGVEAYFWFGINEIFLILAMISAFAWIFSICFEKAFEIKGNNLKLKEENDLTI